MADDRPDRIDLSVIVPAWKEGDKVQKLAEKITSAQGVEVIVVLTQTDNETAWPKGERITTIRSVKGRSAQMNAGSKIAKGECLLFLHADTVIETSSFCTIKKLLADEKVSFGAYRFKTDGDGFMFSILEFAVDLRCRLFSLPYGDQALFVRRSLFEQVKGYDDMPIMEDVALVEKLRCHGRFVLLDFFAQTSARRWKKKGLFFTSLRNLLLLAAYKSGISTRQLTRFY